MRMRSAFWGKKGGFTCSKDSRQTMGDERLGSRRVPHIDLKNEPQGGRKERPDCGDCSFLGQKGGAHEHLQGESSIRREGKKNSLCEILPRPLPRRSGCRADSGGGGGKRRKQRFYLKSICCCTGQGCH